jgi:RNA polymerase sigma factor (sigma-70 family)
MSDKGDDNLQRFEALLREAEPTVRSLLGRMSRDREITEDAYQRACIRAWVAFHQYRPQSKFSTWLCTIARRELAGIMRLSSTKHEGQNVALHDDAGKLLYDQAPKPPPAEEPESLPLAVIVERARQTRLGFGLDDVDVEILRLRAQGLKVKEIAASVGLTYWAAKTRLYKAVVELRLMVAADLIQQHEEDQS